MMTQIIADLEHMLRIKFTSISAMPGDEKIKVNYGYSNSWWGGSNRTIYKTDGEDKEKWVLVETRRCEMRKGDAADYYEVFVRKASFVIVKEEYFSGHSARGVYFHLYLRGFVYPGDNSRPPRW